jgi:hypothetical protein
MRVPIKNLAIYAFSIGALNTTSNIGFAINMP